MVETLPMLETDPRRSFHISRVLRVLVFSLVASLVIVALLIVVVRFFWDTFVVGTPVGEFIDPILPGEGVGPYVAHPLIIVPAMGLIAAFMAKLLWDNSQGTTPARRK